MPVWTKNQQEVIEHKGKNLLVSAAAGSGKTAVMIEHIYTQIVNHNATLERMLVATYTNAAAASMKEKLINKLDYAYQENPENIRILKEKQAVDRADISTLHSYCIKTLKKYYFYTPLPADFRIFQGAQLKMLSNSALEQIIEEGAKRYNDGLFDEYKDVLEQFSGAKSDKSLESLILTLHSSLAPLPHPEQFKENVLNLYSDPSGKVFTDYIISYCKSLLSSAIDLCYKIKEKYFSTDISEKCNTYIDKILIMFENALNKNSFEEILNEITVKFPSINKTDSAYKKPLMDNILVIKNTRETVKKLCLSINRTNLTFLLPAIKGLFALHEDYAKRLDELMLNEGGTNFDGVLRYMVQLIENNPDILEDIRQNTDYIYIDEYQDINAVQNYIIQTISKGDNMFFVGDIKQSIYGFNYARPDLFKEKMFLYNSGHLGNRINLMNNFRSYPQILDGVNFIFKNIMFDENISEIIYDADASLYPSPDETFFQHKNCLYNGETGEIANEILFIDGNKEDEAEAIAKRIKELLNTKIIDPQTNIMRNVRYGDIAILARQKKYSALLDKVFKKHNIPLSAQQDDKNNNTDSINTIISLLNLLILRRSDIDLITVLLSSIGSFTPSELALIRINDPTSSFYDAFVQYDQKPSIVKKRNDFIDLINRLEIIQKSMALADFIEYACNETGYVYHVSFSPEDSGEIRAYNRLLQEARNYSNFADGTLLGFLKYYKNVSRGLEEVPFAIDENDDSVHFMTIHKSKGLEFPIVFVIGMTEASFGGDKSFYFNEHLGFGFNYKLVDEQGKRTEETSIVKTAIQLAKKKLECAEDMRVFYVALTRAKNKLILSCPILKEKLSQYNIIPHKLNFKNFSKYAELVLPLIFNHKDGYLLKNIIRDVDYSTEFEHVFDQSVWTIKIFDSLNDDEVNENIKLSVYDCFDSEEYINKAKNAFEYKYPYTAATTARTKQSPSKSNLRSKTPLRKPTFEDKEYKGAQKGTIVHFFMEHIDFYSTKTVKEQAESMLETGILNNEEFDALPIESIEKFINSPFGKRLSSSKEIARERSFCQIIPFDETGDEALVQGIIDCYFFEGEDIILLDYKTDIIRNNLNDHVLHHTPQLKMYKYALEQLYPGKTVTPYIHFFDIDETVEIK
ncbi:MAG: hypothetical protein E7365_04195 [Clostridiales bacterium]|nr:hypothetical protein [Clostridiales bacterium]